MVACDPGCCKPMCPKVNICPSIRPRAPDYVVRTENMDIVTDIDEIERKISVNKSIDILMTVIIILAFISTIAIAMPQKISLKNMFNK
jgi:hypothetical protein